MLRAAREPGPGPWAAPSSLKAATTVVLEGLHGLAMASGEVERSHVLADEPLTEGVVSHQAGEGPRRGRDDGLEGRTTPPWR